MWIKLLIVLFISCLCNLQGQVWVKVADSAAYGQWDIYTATVDPTSDILYLGGWYQKVNSLNTKSILKYDGLKLDTLGAGLDPQWLSFNSPTIVRSMTMFQNKLYVCGQFEKAGKYYSRNLARWNGSDWDTTNFQITFGNLPMILKVYNNELYVAGTFDSIGGIAANGIAKFDGTNWYSLNHPVQNVCISAMEFYNGKLYVSASTSSASSCANLQYYDGTNWTNWVGVSGNVNKGVWGMRVIDTMLYVYGRFDNIAATNCKGLAAFNGTKWYGFGSGLSTTGGWETIGNVQKIDGEIYVTGNYDKIEGIGTSDFSNSSYPLMTNVMKFDGQKWCAISPPFNNNTSGIIKYKNDLYCYGVYEKIGNDTILDLAKWIGGSSTIACSPTIAITPSTIGINEITLIEGIRIFPNPATKILHIQSENYLEAGTEVEFANTLGQTILKLNYTNEIDVSDLPQGYYILKIISPDKRQFHSKFLKE